MMTHKEITGDIRWHEQMIKTLLTLPERDAWEQEMVVHHSSWIVRLTEMLGPQR